MLGLRRRKRLQPQKNEDCQMFKDNYYPYQPPCNKNDIEIKERRKHRDDIWEDNIEYLERNRPNEATYNEINLKDCKIGYYGEPNILGRICYIKHIPTNSVTISFQNPQDEFRKKEAISVAMNRLNNSIKNDEKILSFLNGHQNKYLQYNHSNTNFNSEVCDMIDEMYKNKLLPKRYYRDIETTDKILKISRLVKMNHNDLTESIVKVLVEDN